MSTSPRPGPATHGVPALAVLSPLVAGCGGKSCGDFRPRVRSEAGPDAESCGDLGIEELRTEAHACLAEAFGDGTDAYAIFRVQSGDSQSGSGVVPRDGGVTFYFFDGDPTGNRSSSSGQITSKRCESPMLSGTVKDFDFPFTLSN